MAVRIDLLPSALRNIRKNLGRTQTEVAAKAGIGQAELSRYELGKQQPTVPRLVAVLDELGADLADLQSAIDNHPDGDGPLRQAIDQRRPTLSDASIVEDARLLERPELRQQFQDLWAAVKDLQDRRSDDET